MNPGPPWRCGKRVGFLFPHLCERSTREGCPDCNNGSVDDPYLRRSRTGYAESSDYDSYSDYETGGSSPASAAGAVFGGGDAGGAGASMDFTEADGGSLVNPDRDFEDGPVGQLRVLIYALGGGWGHLTRAVALASALRPIRRGSSRIALTARLFAKGCRILRLNRCRLARRLRWRSWARARTSSWSTRSRGVWVGSLPILPGLDALKILVHRDLAPEYLAWAGQLREFVESEYDRILCPGEMGPFSDLPNARVTKGWVVRAPRALSAAPAKVSHLRGRQCG